jgi:uncharacterized protein YbbC (DUF1343 family)
MRASHVVLSGGLMVAGLAGCSRAQSQPETAVLACQPIARCADSLRGAPAVRPGLEVLLSDSLHLVRGKRLGLVTNQAGIDHRGTSGVDLLRRAPVTLVALFSPEHGFRGTAAPGAKVDSSVDSATGLPIYSLYGKNSAPTDSMLRGIDVLLIDLQDAGARFYTYLWTTIGILRSAGRNHIPVILLDRPNPIGGVVQGNVLDTAYRTGVGYDALPMRHGMTLGELARFSRHNFGLTGAFTVVPVAGWHRSMYLDETGLPYVPPSPNLKTIESLIHYPGTCLFEGTTLSVGRGTDAPFEQVGAPWLDTAAVLSRLKRDRIPGVEFRGVSFTPRNPGDGKFADTLLAGIRLRVTNRDDYDPTITAIALLAAIADAPTITGGTPAPIPGDSRHLQRLYGQPLTVLEQQLEALQRGSSIGATRGNANWPAQVNEFRIRRRPFLLYPE